MRYAFCAAFTSYPGIIDSASADGPSAKDGTTAHADNPADIDSRFPKRAVFFPAKKLAYQIIFSAFGGH